MNVIVLASACRSGGALSIYRQFITHLPIYVKDNKYYIFVDPSMDQPVMKNVLYIHEVDHSWKRRVYMNRKGYLQTIKSMNVVPDVIFSLQNSGIITDCRQVIYYHQSLPFFRRFWNPFKVSERHLFMYQHFYPYFVKKTLNDRTDIIVQIPYIKKGFVNKFKYDPNKVHVIFPDVEYVDVNAVLNIELEPQYVHFIYPASSAPYKEHITIVKALDELRKIEYDLVSRIRIHLTIEKNSNIALYNLIVKKGLVRCFIFHGSLPHKTLMSYYRSVLGLLFPSTIETLGLPLLEAAAFGIPIIVSDLDYAHEVLYNYSGVFFTPARNSKLWAQNIRYLCTNRMVFPRLQHQDSQWNNIFELIYQS